jgi:DNA-binding NarL/FixJ family response regulator
MDKAHYDLTGEIKMVEEFQVYVPPVVTEAEVAVQKIARRRPFIMSNKPSSEQLERYLRHGMSFAEIAVKQKSSVATVGNWIRSYGLQGIKGKKKPKEAFL